MNKQFVPEEWVKTVKPPKKGPQCTICVNLEATAAIAKVIDLIDNKNASITMTSMVPMLEEYFDLIVNSAVVHHHVKAHIRGPRDMAIRQARKLQEAKARKKN